MVIVTRKQVRRIIKETMLSEAFASIPAFDAAARKKMVQSAIRLHNRKHGIKKKKKKAMITKSSLRSRNADGEISSKLWDLMKKAEEDGFLGKPDASAGQPDYIQYYYGSRYDFGKATRERLMDDYYYLFSGYVKPETESFITDVSKLEKAGKFPHMKPATALKHGGGPKEDIDKVISHYKTTHSKSPQPGYIPAPLSQEFDSWVQGLSVEEGASGQEYHHWVKDEWVKRPDNERELAKQLRELINDKFFSRLAKKREMNNESYREDQDLKIQLRAERMRQLGYDPILPLPEPDEKNWNGEVPWFFTLDGIDPKRKKLSGYGPDGIVHNLEIDDRDPYM